MGNPELLKKRENRRRERRNRFAPPATSVSREDLIGETKDQPKPKRQRKKRNGSQH